MRLDARLAEMLSPWFAPEVLARTRIVSRGPVCWFVRNVLRQGAMAFSPFVFFGRERFEADRLASVALLAHELKHLEQYGRYGHIGFLRRYFWDLGRRRFRYIGTFRWKRRPTPSRARPGPFCVSVRAG
jgi:hypothetical protein